MPATAAIKAVTSASELAIKAWQLADAIKNVELMSTLTALSNHLADAKIQAVYLRNEIAERAEENAWLKEQLKKVMTDQGVLALKDGLYYQPNGQGPFCATCYDTQKKLIRAIQRNGQPATNVGRWYCGVCKTNYR